MATLNTRIVLRNDSSANWLTNETQVLLKGEVGIEFLADGKVKMKIGDGVTAWSSLPYFGGEESHVFEATVAENETKEEAITRVVGDTDLAKGDIAIVKKLISTDKYEYTAYVYNGTAWAAMDGNYSAENVYFDQDLLTTTAVGNISLSNGQATVPVTGKNLIEAWQTIYVKEDTDISVTNPSVSVSGNVTYLEIGSSDSQDVTITYEDGSYEYGYTTETGSEGDSATTVVNNGTTGATVTAYTLTDGTNAINPKTEGGSTFTVSSGTKTAKGSFSVKGSATYTNGYNPVSNLKKMYPSKAITSATTAVVTKELFRWYVPMYYGFKYSGSTIASPSSITADEIKALTVVKDATAYNNTKPTSATATASWMQFFVAVPSSYNAELKGIVDSNNLPLTVEKATNVNISFGDASIEYEVWFVNLAANYDTKAITLKW